MSEEHPLQGFVHVPLATQIGLSGFGALLQISRLNYFRCRDFPAAFGIRYRYTQDLSEVFVTSSKRRDILASVFEAPASLTSLWPIDLWQPFNGTDPWEFVPWRLRACVLCLRIGYHSNLFQMPWITTCPWHREPLIESCKRCGKGLLEGTVGNDLLLQCRCGLDHTSDIAILGGERPDTARERTSYVENYLAHAAARRAAGDLLIPPEEFDVHARDGLRALFDVSTTAYSAMPPSAIHVHDCTNRSAASAGTLFTREDIIGTVKNLWPDKPGVATLPLHLWPGLRGVTRNVAKGASGAALSARCSNCLPPPTRGRFTPEQSFSCFQRGPPGFTRFWTPACSIGRRGGRCRISHRSCRQTRRRELRGIRPRKPSSFGHFGPVSQGHMQMASSTCLVDMCLRFSTCLGSDPAREFLGYW